jgi:hypothetical protein
LSNCGGVDETGRHCQNFWCPSISDIEDDISQKKNLTIRNNKCTDVRSCAVLLIVFEYFVLNKKGALFTRERSFEREAELKIEALNVVLEVK